MATSRLAYLAGALWLLTTAAAIRAEAPAAVRSEFVQWAKESLYPVSAADLDAPTTDLAPIGKMIGAARIVAYSPEAQPGR
jgi:hypothetical protein